MKIAFISHSFPYPPNKGERQRALFLIKALAKTHQVTLFSVTKEDIPQSDIDQLCQYVDKVYCFNAPPVIKFLQAGFSLLKGNSLTEGYFYSCKLKRALEREGPFDLFFGYCSSSVQYLQDERETPAVMDMVDVDSAKWSLYAQKSSLLKKSLYKLEAKRVLELEKRSIERCDWIGLTTQFEIEKIKNLTTEAEKLVVLKNGVDLTTWKRTTELKAQPCVIGFMGQMDYQPNIEAIRWFHDQVFDLIRKKVPEAQFLVIGRNPSESLVNSCLHAEFTGEVERVEPYLEKAAVFIAPMQETIGVPVKVLQALSFGVPVVATSYVAKGLESSDSQAAPLVEVDAPQEMADRVVELLKDVDKRSELGQRSRSYAESELGWGRTEELLRKLVPN